MKAKLSQETALNGAAAPQLPPMRRDAAFGFRGPSRRRDGGSEAAVGSPMPTGIGPSTQIYPIAPRAGTGELSGCRSRCLLRALRQVVLGPRARAPIVPMVTAGSIHVVLHAALLAAPVSATRLPFFAGAAQELAVGFTSARAFRRHGRAGAHVVLPQPCAIVSIRSARGRVAPQAGGSRREESRADPTRPWRTWNDIAICVRCQHR